MRPSTPRYTATWDIHTVLEYFRQASDNQGLSLKDLTLKTVMLILLVTAARGQDVHLIDLAHISTSNGVVTCTIPALTKCAKPGKKPRILVIPFTQ